jgi:transposase-like protein
MPYRPTKIGSLVRLDPAQARDRIVEAFRASGASYSKVASDLGVSGVTFWRWVGVLALKAQLDEIQAKAEKSGTRYDGRTTGQVKRRKRAAA